MTVQDRSELFGPDKQTLADKLMGRRVLLLEESTLFVVLSEHDWSGSLGRRAGG